MFKHTFHGSLFAPDPAPAGGGGDQSAVIDMGAPFVIDPDVKPAPAAPKPEKSDTDKRLDAMAAELEGLKRTNRELEDSNRYWSERARGGQPPAPEPEPELDDTPTPRVVADPDEKPEKLLDDMSVDGLKALRIRGIITEDQLFDELDKREQRLLQQVEQRLETNNRHNQMDAELAKFPDLMADSNRVKNGLAPQSEHYKRTQQHFREMVDLDPSLKSSSAALIKAARMAARELELEGKVNDSGRNNRQQERRDRIDAQRGDNRDHATLDEGSDPLSPTARQVVSNLSRFGATDDSFRSFASGPPPARKR